MEINSYQDNNYDGEIDGESNFGTSIKGENYGHMVFQLNANDNSDSFNFLSKNYFEKSDPRFNNLLTIKSNGKVGINTKNPSKQLEINGDLKITNDNPTNTSIKFLDSNKIIKNQLILKDTYLAFQNNKTEVLTISNLESKIGINTNDPKCSLDINDNKLRIRQPSEIPNNNTSGEEGEIRWNQNAIYICMGYDSSNKIYLWKISVLENI
jgi:hypothetical protein